MSAHSTRVANWLRRTDYLVDFCERKIPRPGCPFPVSKDLFGLFDLMVIPPTGSVIGIQVTGESQRSHHIRKYEQDPQLALALRRWTATGNRFQLVQVRKRGFRYEWKRIWLVMDGDQVGYKESEWEKPHGGGEEREYAEM